MIALSLSLSLSYSLTLKLGFALCALQTCGTFRPVIGRDGVAVKPAVSPLSITLFTLKTAASISATLKPAVFEVAIRTAALWGAYQNGGGAVGKTQGYRCKLTLRWGLLW